jgi:LytS/YehU family sensor histidine kinase
MRGNINKLILEIQQKAQLESELQESKLLLQQSQLRNLQSRINPHFLFNNLNTLSKIAYLDGAEETSDLLLYVSFDNEKVRERQAEALLELVSKGNYVYIGGAPTDNNAH